MLEKMWDKVLKVTPPILGTLLIAIVTAAGTFVLIMIIKLIIMLLGGM